MKKRIILLLLSGLIALALVACGGRAAEEEPTASDPVEQVEEPAAEEPAAEEPMEEEPMEEEPMEEEPMEEEPMEEEPMEEEPMEEEPMEEEPMEEEPMEEMAADPTDMGDFKGEFSDCAEDLSGETITIYQQAGLTGPLAQILGDGFINGTVDAVTFVNDNGGVCGATFEIRLEDTQYDPEQELAVYEQFRAEDPKPLFTLTYGSGASIVLKDRVIEDEILNIAAGLNAEAFYVPRDGWTVGAAPIYSDQFAGFLTWLSENWADVKPETAGDDIVVGVVGWANDFGAGATTPEALAVADELGITVLPLEQQEISPTADVTGQLQNLLVNGANVVYIQSLSFGPAQVIGTIRALGQWDNLVVGGVNWSMNRDVANILGENAALMNGFYGMFPSLWWNDTDASGVQQALASFEAGGYPETQKGVSYLLSYGQVFALADIIQHAVNNDGYENLSGETFFDAMKEMGLVSAGGLYNVDVRDQNRSPRVSQIRQAQVQEDGSVDFIVIEDFFELPDTRPPAE